MKEYSIMHVKGRPLNGVYTGGYATLREEVVVMGYILKIIFLAIVLLITFTIDVK